MDINDSLSSLLTFSIQLDDIERKFKDEELQIQIRHREKSQPLFTERHDALKSVPNFWSGVFASPDTPLAPLRNGTFDIRIAKAITDFEVVTRSEQGKLMRKVILTFTTNMVLEAGSVFREVDSDGVTTALQPIQWKKGTENLRKNSLFSFFDETPSEGEEFVEEAVKAFDLTYQDPFLAMIPEN